MYSYMRRRCVSSVSSSTSSVKDVSLAKFFDVVAEATGARWVVESRGGTTYVRFLPRK